MSDNLELGKVQVVRNGEYGEVTEVRITDATNDRIKNNLPAVKRLIEGMPNKISQIRTSLMFDTVLSFRAIVDSLAERNDMDADRMVGLILESQLRTEYACTFPVATYFHGQGTDVPAYRGMFVINKDGSMSMTIAENTDRWNQKYSKQIIDLWGFASSFNMTNEVVDMMYQRVFNGNDAYDEYLSVFCSISDNEFERHSAVKMLENTFGDPTSGKPRKQYVLLDDSLVILYGIDDCYKYVKEHIDENVKESSFKKKKGWEKYFKCIEPVKPKKDDRFIKQEMYCLKKNDRIRVKNLKDGYKHAKVFCGCKLTIEEFLDFGWKKYFDTCTVYFDK